MGNSWAVDLANVTAVYPWQGTEVIMVVLGLVLWIGWHIVQFRQENEDYADDLARYGDKNTIMTALDEDPHSY